MDEIFTIDEFPVALSSISRRVASLQVIVPTFHTLSAAQKKGMQHDMSEVFELCQKLERSLKSLKHQQLIYQKWKTQLDQQITRFTHVVSVLHTEEEAQTEETSHLLQQQSFEAQMTQELVHDRGEGISRVALALQTANSLIKEFGQMVHEQASKVESIEEFMDASAHHSQLALDHVEKANERDKTSRQHKFLLCLLVSVALCCLVLTSVSLN